MPTTEHTINDTLASILRTTRHTWRETEAVKSEQSGMLKDSSAQPDIIVIESNISPVTIEVEVLPAVSVEEEATSRLGEAMRVTGRKILSSIAVRLPTRIRIKQGRLLKDELQNASDIEMALYTGTEPSSYSRWPHSGWIVGTITDLSILTQAASVPPEIIDEAVNQLVNGVGEVAGLLAEIAQSHPGAIHKISQELCQEDSEQTRRMAATILANAFVFHEILAGGQDELADVNSLEQLRGSSDGLNKSSILTEWRKILKVNYWPIFDISRRIFEEIPTAESSAIIDRLIVTADKLLQNQLMRSNDVTGAIFQKLISDRKFLAAFYTTPASATLLAGLSITPGILPSDKSWTNEEDVKSLRIADFACGTGTLLSIVYQRVIQIFENAGGDAEKIHPDMMADSLVGCDVLPAAAHLTASMLAGAYPTVKYLKSSILTVPYGKQPDGIFALGSLDLLASQGQFDLLAPVAKALEGLGEAERKTWQSLPHASFDVVIMNPPFTRATGQEGAKIGVPNPMFAAFSSSEEEQRMMAHAMDRLTKGTSSHGNAGEASIFLVLAHRKLKPSGQLAMVMPLSLMSGEAWEDSRVLLAKNYQNLILISISGVNDSDLSFSADTGMGECLVVGHKSDPGSTRATFVILKERPAYPLIGANVAKQINS